MQDNKIKILVTILDRGKSNKVIEVCDNNKIYFHYILHGKGTASSEIMDYLGIGETEKDIVISFVRENSIERILNIFNYDLKMSQPGTGIAFTIPLSKINSLLNKLCIDNEQLEKEGNNMERKYGLIICVINHGNVDLVMDAAKEKGATGGTVLNARAVLNTDLEKFFGITVHPEKDIIAIVAAKEKELDIMKAVQNVEIPDQEDHIMAFSLPVDNLIGIRQRTE